MCVYQQRQAASWRDLQVVPLELLLCKNSRMLTQHAGRLPVEEAAHFWSEPHPSWVCGKSHTPPGYVGRATPLLGMWGDNNIYGYSANTRQPKWIGDYMAVAKQLHTVDKSLAYWGIKYRQWGHTEVLQCIHKATCTGFTSQYNHVYTADKNSCNKVCLLLYSSFSR